MPVGARRVLAHRWTKPLNGLSMSECWPIALRSGYASVVGVGFGVWVVTPTAVGAG